MLSERLAILAARCRDRRRQAGFPDQPFVRRPDLLFPLYGQPRDYELFSNRNRLETEPENSRIQTPRKRKSSANYVMGQGHRYLLGESNPVEYI